MSAVAEKLHDAVVKFDTHRNVQRHRGVLPAIARLSFALRFVAKRYKPILQQKCLNGQIGTCLI